MVKLRTRFVFDVFFCFLFLSVCYLLFRTPVISLYRLYVQWQSLWNLIFFSTLSYLQHVVQWVMHVVTVGHLFSFHLICLQSYQQHVFEVGPGGLFWSALARVICRMWLRLALRDWVWVGVMFSQKTDSMKTGWLNDSRSCSKVPLGGPVKCCQTHKQKHTHFGKTHPVPNRPASAAVS